MKTLYSKQGEKLRVWNVWTEGPTVVVSHGQQGGKISEKRYDASPKNEGRANATTAEQQALVEAEAKYVKQLKSGYYVTEEEAMSHIDFTPMKAQNSDDHRDKLKFPCYLQPKLNGQRLMIDKNGAAWSKQGESLTLPSHWEGVEQVAKLVGGLDGEVYAGLESQGGLSLQKVISAFRKPNTDTSKLKLFVYDIPTTGRSYKERDNTLYVVESLAKENLFSSIVVVQALLVNSFEEALKATRQFVLLGYEGGILRNLDGEYEFGKRSYDLQKLKFREDAEARVVSVQIDKNKNGVLLCEAVNGEQTGVQFECLMRKDSHETVNYREYSNAVTLIGKTITYQYEELSDKLVPTKPVGIALREVLPNGEGRF